MQKQSSHFRSNRLPAGGSPAIARDCRNRSATLILHSMTRTSKTMTMQGDICSQKVTSVWFTVLSGFTCDGVKDVPFETGRDPDQGYPPFPEPQQQKKRHN